MTEAEFADLRGNAEGAVRRVALRLFHRRGRDSLMRAYLAASAAARHGTRHPTREHLRAEALDQLVHRKLVGCAEVLRVHVQMQWEGRTDYGDAMELRSLAAALEQYARVLRRAATEIAREREVPK